MACGGCNKRRMTQYKNNGEYDVLGGFKTLPERQLKARLETYKKIHCPECDTRYDCDYPMYINCKGK